MSPTQPAPALARVADTTPPVDRRAARLLKTWVTITQRLIDSSAHGGDDEDELRELQVHVENDIRRHVPGGSALVTELWVWEAGFLHESQATSDACLVCRRALLGLPPDLPIPESLGRTR